MWRDKFSWLYCHVLTPERDFFLSNAWIWQFQNQDCFLVATPFLGSKLYLENNEKYKAMPRFHITDLHGVHLPHFGYVTIHTSSGKTSKSRTLLKLFLKLYVRTHPDGWIASSGFDVLEAIELFLMSSVYLSRIGSNVNSSIAVTVKHTWEKTSLHRLRWDAKTPGHRRWHTFSILSSEKWILSRLIDQNLCQGCACYH